MSEQLSFISAPNSELTGSAALFRNIQSAPGELFIRPPLMSAKREGQIARRDAVKGARHVERYSELIRGGIDRKADMTVGPNLRVHAQPDWDLLGLNEGDDGWKTKKPFALACQREFNNWAYDSRLLQDAEGHYNFGGMMWLAFRNLTGPDGECAGVIHYDEKRAERYNARWATFVSIVDPDRIETPSLLVNDKNVHEGKRLDEYGRMISLFIRVNHPSDGWDGATRDYLEVPRETPWGRAMAFHWFNKTRGGQQRGITNLITILRQSGMLDRFDDAQLGAATINAMLATFVKSQASTETVAENLAPAPDVTNSGFEQRFGDKLGYYNKTRMRVAGARIPVLPDGDEIMMTAVDRANTDPAPFRNGFLREFASAIGISFETLSQNYSDANYSAARASLLDAWRGVMKMRAFFTSHVATLVYAAVIEEAIAKGRIKLPSGAPPFQENRAAYTACKWTGPGMGWIDPQKEATAIKTLLEIKTTSRAKVAAENGDDYLEIFDDIEQERQDAEDRGFELDPPLPGAQSAEDPQGSADDAAPPGAPKPKKKGAGGAPARDGDGDGVVDEKDA